MHFYDPSTKTSNCECFGEGLIKVQNSTFSYRISFTKAPHSHKKLRCSGAIVKGKPIATLDQNPIGSLVVIGGPHSTVVAFALHNPAVLGIAAPYFPIFRIFLMVQR